MAIKIVMSITLVRRFDNKFLNLINGFLSSRRVICPPTPQILLPIVNDLLPGENGGEGAGSNPFYDGVICVCTSKHVQRLTQKCYSAIKAMADMEAMNF